MTLLNGVCVCFYACTRSCFFSVKKPHPVLSVLHSPCMYGQLFATAFPLEATEGFLLLGQRPTNMITCLFSRSRDSYVNLQITLICD